MKNCSRSHRLALGIVLITLRAAEAFAGPTTAPSQIVMPPGCIRIEVCGRSFITDPTDAEWVRQAGIAVQAASGTQPATQAADLASRFQAQRMTVAKTMLTDLPMLKADDVESFFDDKLIPKLGHAAAIHAFPVYLILSYDHLTEIVYQGWSDPHVQYNKITQSLDFNRIIAISTTQPAESVIPLVADTTLTPEERTIRLTDAVRHTELQLQQDVAATETGAAVNEFVHFLSQTALSNLPKGRDQLWFSTGLTTVLAARYVSLFHGAALAQFVAEMIQPPPHDPIDDSTVNLLSPFSKDDLRPELVVPYGKACDRKSIAVMYLWLNKAGSTKIAVTLQAVRRLPPADGTTLTRMIEGRQRRRLVRHSNGARSLALNVLRGTIRRRYIPVSAKAHQTGQAKRSE